VRGPKYALDPGVIAGIEVDQEIHEGALEKLCRCAMRCTIQAISNRPS